MMRVNPTADEFRSVGVKEAMALLGLKLEPRTEADVAGFALCTSQFPCRCGAVGGGCRRETRGVGRFGFICVRAATGPVAGEGRLILRGAGLVRV